MIKTILLLVCYFASMSSHSIIIRHDKSDEKYRELAEKYKPSMAYLEFCAGTVIDLYWVVTAAHCVNPTEKFPKYINHLGIKYPVKNIVVHPDAVDSIDLDLALLELSWPLDNAKPVDLYRESNELQKNVTFVGKGKTGTGISGDKIRDKIERAATNTVTSVEKNWLTFNFNAPSTATELEGVSGVEDSGGPAFIEKDNKILLAGVGCCQEPVKGNDGVELQGGYNSTEYYSRVSTYSTWIDKRMASRDEIKGTRHPIIMAFENNNIKAAIILMTADDDWLNHPLLVEKILLNLFYRQSISFIEHFFITFPRLLQQEIDDLPLPVYAYMQGNGELFSLLVNQGLKLNYQGFKGQNYLSLLTWQYFNDDYNSLIKLLLRKGFNINSQDQRGDAAIHLAGFLGWPERIKFLVANGADINLADNNGKTVLMDMARKGMLNWPSY